MRALEVVTLIESSCSLVKTAQTAVVQSLLGPGHQHIGMSYAPQSLQQPAAERFLADCRQPELARDSP